MLKEYIKKWKKKSLFSKISDIIFVLLIITMLIPQGRMAVGSMINRAKSMISQPDLMDNGVSITDASFNWKMTKADGGDFNMNEAKGKVVFLNLWATWCPPCVGEMPGIQKLYDKYKDHPEVEFVLVSNEKTATIKAFAERKKYTFPLYSSTEQTPAVFSSRSIPTTYVISKKGEIVVKEIGAVNWGGKKMVKIIDELINS